MKQMKLGMKLLVGGLLIMALPIIIIGVIAVRESSLNITAMGTRELENTAQGLAAAVDTAMDGQVITIKNIAGTNSVIAAAEKVAKEGARAGQNEILAAQQELARAKKTAADRNVTVRLIGKDRVVFASSDEGKANGENLSGSDYIDAALRGSASVGSILISQQTGKVVVNAVCPIYDIQGKEITGAVVMGMDLTLISDILSKIKVGATGYAYVVDKEGRYIHHPDKDRIMKENVAQVKGMENLMHLIGQGKGGNSEYVSSEGVRKLSAIALVPATGWTVIVNIFTEELYSPARVTRNVIVTITLASLLLAALIFFFFARTITGPVNKLVGVAEKIAVGDLHVVLAAESHRDEIGSLTRAFGDMITSLQEKTRIAQKISEGDLTVAQTAFGATDALGNAFASMAGTLRQQIREIGDGVNVLASSGSEIMATLSQLSSSVAQTATAVTETTTTAEEVKQTTDVNAQKANQVSELGRRTLDVSQKGQKAIEDTIQGMNRIMEQVEAISDLVVRLSEQSQAIGQIIGTVNDLAEQSNLLAVNASIEAAKAGEQGKGFGVVAQEIRSLASQSKQATAQIRGILFDVQKGISSAVMATEQGSKAVEEGVKLSRLAGEAMHVLVESVAQATDATIQIAASSQQQLVGTEQVVLAMVSIREATLQMSAGTKQTEQTVQDLHNLSRRLQDIIKFYRV